MNHNLYGQIYHAVHNHPEAGLLPQERKDEMTDSLTKWVEDAIEKYYKGQKEHGGDICNRNLPVEIRHEQIDQFWFTEAEGWVASR